MIKQFFDFIIERQTIWHNRFIEKLPPPWSKDEILQKYRFCNAYRELDKGTLYLIHTIINADLPLPDKIFNIILYRRFNVCNFFELIGGAVNVNEFDFNTYEDKLDELVLNKVKLFNEAYTICQIPVDNYRKTEKHIQILISQKQIAEEIDDICNLVIMNGTFARDGNIKNIHDRLMKFKTIGHFLAYQILIDLTYIKGLIYKDINSFVHVGPGAKTGLELIFGKYEFEDCEKLFLSQRDYLSSKHWNNIRYKDAFYKSPYLSINNIQASLCEFRKYIMLQCNPNSRKRYYNHKEV